MNELNIQMLATPRTGSTYMCNALNHYPESEIDIGEKYWGTRHLVENNNLHRHSKLFPAFLEHAHLYEIIDKYPNTKFLHMMRRSLVDQAVSMYMVKVTGKWIVSEKEIDDYKLLYNMRYQNNLKSEIKMTEKARKIWPDYLSKHKDIEVYDIYYEDFFQDPISSMGGILRYLSLNEKYASMCVNNVNIKKLSNIKSLYYNILKAEARRIIK